jgi:2-amino-4-hydroxy-6-hydroxymethyldihydropteridine diphosphokinase
MKVALGLGTNVGDRLAFLEDAVFRLRTLVSDIHTSPIYESAALLPEGAHETWDTPFLNMALVGETALAPQALLVAIKALEIKLGRQTRGHWGPREIDIDILLYGQEVVDAPELNIPHPHLLSRDFALKPLADIAPNWVYPAGEHQGKTIGELMNELFSTQPPLHRFL